MTNTNCLENIKCPSCGDEDRFRIAGTTIFTVTDDGTDDYGDIEWDDNGYAECTNCGRHGTLKDFRVVATVPATVDTNVATEQQPTLKLLDALKISEGFVHWALDHGADRPATSAALTVIREAITQAEAARIPPATASTDIHELLAERRQVALIWSIEDVQDIRPDLNDDQCWEVLQDVDHHKDAELGITWLTLKMAAEHLFGSAPENDDARRDDHE